MIYQISEIFYSLQWEGRNTGKPSIFIRFFGCNLKCERCDSKYARAKEYLSEKIEYSLNELLDKIFEYPWKHIVFTWWEPALFEKQIKVLQDILWEGYTFEIETNWSLPLINKYSQVNVSYKFLSSGNKKYPLKALNNKYDYKFVIDTEEDIKEMEQIIKEYNLKNIFIMPLWRTKESQSREDIIKYCMNNNYNYCQRTHLILFWDKRWV